MATHVATHAPRCPASTAWSSVATSKTDTGAAPAVAAFRPFSPYRATSATFAASAALTTTSIYGRPHVVLLRPRGV